MEGSMAVHAGEAILDCLVTASARAGFPFPLMQGVAALMDRDLIPIEMAFIDGLARRASCGRTPAPMPAETIEVATAATTGGAETTNEIREGEREGYALLAAAHLEKSHATIAGFLSDFIERGDFNPRSAGAISVICGAAMTVKKH